jgi:glycosyltransferase involved in cell wall biosynthesis
LDSVLATAYAPGRYEVLVADGMSDDGTRAILEEYARRHPVIRIVDNPRKSAAAALNTAIPHARGELIVRMDAHAVYPASYLPALVEHLERSGADNVGGVCLTRPANGSTKAAAIAIGLAHPFGVGNSYFRIGTDRPRWVDTVPFGCYRRDVFERIGLFDEALVRNQDDEFNFRLLRRGGRILLAPDVTCEYFGRPTLSALWRMFYQYGYYKPLVARKVGAVLTIRQLIPALFVGAVAVFGILAVWSDLGRSLARATLAAYATLTVLVAMQAAAKHGMGPAVWLAVVFPVLHVGYGLGFLRGVVDFLIRARGTGTRAASAGLATSESLDRV